MIEILAGIGSVSSAIIATVTCIALLIKPIRNKILGGISEKEALKCLLRNEITQIYYKHLSDCELKEYEFENVTRMYKAYKTFKGNTFVDKIYAEMRDTWRIVSCA